jgi:hypothetical protein
MNELETKAIGKAAPWLITAGKEAGLDLDGLTHEVSNYFKSHSLNRHGNPVTEQRLGQIAVTEADFSLIPDIITAPDLTVIGIKWNQQTHIAYAKRIGEITYIYFEEVLNSRKNKAMRSASLYKRPQETDMDMFIKIITHNAHNDISGIKKVKGAGGRPGDEAEAY